MNRMLKILRGCNVASHRRSLIKSFLASLMKRAAKLLPHFTYLIFNIVEYISLIKISILVDKIAIHCSSIISFRKK